MGWVALSALLVSACDDPASAPPPKPPTTTAVTPKEALPPPPPAPPPPMTEIPATSTSAEAVAAYRSAIDLGDNLRGEEARGQLKKALGLDPSFTTAIVQLAMWTPDAEGDAAIAAAIAKADKLPEAEKVYLQMMQAGHLGDTAKRGELAKKLADMLPASARAQYLNASSLNNLGSFEAAKGAYKKSLELNPEYAPALNEGAYLEMYLSDTDAAIGHLQKYVSLHPKEPNAYDSLAEGLLLAGKLDESEATFKKALEADPKFTTANGGIGIVNLYRGDAKGMEALAKYRDDASLTSDEKAFAYFNIAWAQAGLGKTADAMKTVDAWDADAKKTNNPEAGFWPAEVRLEITAESGKTDEALKQITALDTRVTQSSAPATRKARWRLFIHTDETIIYGRTKKAAEADRSRALVDTLAPEVGGNDAKIWSAIAHGNALLAKGDAAGAVKEFAVCPNGESYCVWERMKAEDKAGLKAQAAATKELLVKERRRFGQAFFVWSKVAPPKK